MSIVDFNTSIWKDAWFRKLSVKAKILFVFLWTNDHKNLSCLYEIDIDTISFYTGLTVKDVKDTLLVLYPKVKYDFENEVVWVVKFVRHQFMRTPNTSPKIITGIRNNLVQSNGHFFIGEFLKEYQSLNISFEYPIDTVSEGYAYPPGGGGGEGGGKKVPLNIIKVREVISLFHDILPSLPMVEISTELKKRVEARIRGHKDRHTAAWWKWYFEGIGECDFLMGKKTDWSAGFYWLTGPKNMIKVLSGEYVNRDKKQREGHVIREFIDG